MFQLMGRWIDSLPGCGWKIHSKAHKEKEEKRVVVVPSSLSLRVVSYSTLGRLRQTFFVFFFFFFLDNRERGKKNVEGIITKLMGSMRSKRTWVDKAES